MLDPVNALEYKELYVRTMNLVWGSTDCQAQITGQKALQKEEVIDMLL